MSKYRQFVERSPGERIQYFKYLYTPAGRLFLWLCDARLKLLRGFSRNYLGLIGRVAVYWVPCWGR